MTCSERPAGAGSAASAVALERASTDRLMPPYDPAARRTAGPPGAYDPLAHAYDPSNTQVVGPAADPGPAKTRWALSVPIRRLALMPTTPAPADDPRRGSPGNRTGQEPFRRTQPAAPVAVRAAGARPAVRGGRRRGRRLVYGAGDPARTEVDRGRAGGRPGHGRGVARGAVSAAARARRGGAVRAAAVAGGPAARRGRGVDAGRSVPASAAAARSRSTTVGPRGSCCRAARRI